MRIGIIGENSLEFIGYLFEIWNNGDSAVLMDWRIPLHISLKMLTDMGVKECYVEDAFIKNNSINEYENIDLKIYHSAPHSSAFLPTEIKQQYTYNDSTDEAIVILSSGTTGKNKGIILSHFAISANANAIIKYAHFNSDTKIYIVKPLFHSSTLTGELLAGLISGAQIYIGKSIMPLSQIFDTIYRHSINTICLNPHLLELYLDYYLKNDNIKTKFNSIKTIYSSGDIITTSLLNKARAGFKSTNIFNMYGLSEAGPRVAAQTARFCNQNSVGIPIDGVCVKILDADNRKLHSNQIGEIHVKTPGLFSGYALHDNCNATVTNNWLKTGDMGYFDNNGELYVCGRKDDSILINSHLIYPAHIEDIISNYPGIDECIVVKNQDNLICYYTSDKTINNSQIQKYCMQKLAIYEIPKEYFHVESIPRTDLGKICRNNHKSL